MNLTEKIENSIVQDIKNGFYCSNQKLPTIKELSLVFGTSDIVVRNAIKNLKTRNILSAKQGSGIFVKEKPLAQKATIAVFLPEMDILRKDNIHDAHFNILDELIVKHNKNEKYGYNLLFSFEKFKLSALKGLDINGAIFIGIPPDDKLIEYLKNTNTPYVFAGRTLKYDNINFVDYDHIGALHNTLKLFVSRGHKKICFASRNTLNKNRQKELEESFFNCLYKNKLSISQSKFLLIDQNTSLETSIEQVIANVSAIYCRGPYEADIIYKTLIQKGINIPGHISLIAFGFSELYENKNNISGYKISLNNYVLSLLESIEKQLSGKKFKKEKIIEAEWFKGITLNSKQRD